MDSAQFREAASSAIDEIANYYDTIEKRRVVSNVEPGYLRKLLPEAAPAKGEQWADIQKDIEAKIMPGLTHWHSPNFFAFFPANSSFPGILGELYSAALTAPAFNWICSPAITELETIVLDWVAKIINLPDCYFSHGEGGGVIQGSASEAIVTVMIAARDKYLHETTAHLSGEDQEDAIALKRGKLVALGSDQAHSSTQKAAQICGVRYKTVPTSAENDFSMKGAELTKVLEECKAKGLEPFYLTATLGSTSTCAVDDFASIASALQSYSCPSGQPGEIWVHVDAAHAGSALVLPEYHHLTSSFEHFNSFDFNMHKWLLTNFDASLLYIKKRHDLTAALSITPAYLRNEFTESGLVTDYRDWQIPLGRRFRSLKIWFVLRSYGVEGLQAYIKNHIQLGEYFHSLVSSRPDLFKVISGPNFALTVLHVVPSTVTAGGTNSKTEADKITKTVYELINKRGEIYLTSTVVRGQYAIRVISASRATEEKYLKKAFDILVDTAEEVRDGKVSTRTPQLAEVGKGEGVGEVTGAGDR